MGAMRWGNKENKWKEQTETERYREGAYIEGRNKKEKERAWGYSSSHSGERGEEKR